MGVRERLEGRAPRREAFPVLIDDVTEPAAAVEAAQRALLEARAADAAAGAAEPSQAARDAQSAYDGAREAVQACFEDVWFTPIRGTQERSGAAELERLLNEHQKPDGELDREAFRPFLAAACAEDPDLQDAAWWAEQFPRWAAGEVDALYELLWQLNYSAPRPGLGKG